MNLEQYYQAINEQLAPHGKGIMMCVAKKFFIKDLTVQEVVQSFLHPESIPTYHDRNS